MQHEQHAQKPWDRYDIWDPYLVKEISAERLFKSIRWAVVRIADGATVFVSANRMLADEHMQKNCRRKKYEVMEYHGYLPDGMIGKGW